MAVRAAGVIARALTVVDSSGLLVAMRVLLLSAYHAHSHRRWCRGLVAAFPDIDWTVLTLPPRHFSWRVRGNSLSWAFSERERLQAPYDVLLATSMTDLSALRGMVPSLASVPSLLYFHENQFAYPDRREQARIEPCVVSLYAALSADAVVFNSEWNRASFLDGVDELLGKMPDAVPPGVRATLEERSSVVPVPVEDDWFSDTPRPVARDQPLTLVWNHRWEHDKAPERLFAALLELKAAGAAFRVHVIGQQFREQPPVFEESRALLGDSVGEWGAVAAGEDYRRVLRSSHVVMSTSLHEFQGLAVLEAAACGCFALVPDRLSYPELFPAGSLYPSFPDDPVAESHGLARRLARLAEAYAQGSLPPAADVGRFAWRVLRPNYAALLDRLAG